MASSHDTAPLSAIPIVSPLHERIAELVDVACGEPADADEPDEPDVVDSLVSTARWNPALLQVAIDAAAALAATPSDERGLDDDQMDRAIARLGRAQEIVRRRAY